MQAATAANETSGLPFEEADSIMKDIKDELVSSEALTLDRRPHPLKDPGRVAPRL